MLDSGEPGVEHELGSKKECGDERRSAAEVMTASSFAGSWAEISFMTYVLVCANSAEFAHTRIVHCGKGNIIRRLHQHSF